MTEKSLVTTVAQHSDLKKQRQYDSLYGTLNVIIPGPEVIVVWGPFASHKVHSKVGVDRMMSEFEWPNSMFYKKPYASWKQDSDCFWIYMEAAVILGGIVKTLK